MTNWMNQGLQSARGLRFGNACRCSQPFNHAIARFGACLVPFVGIGTMIMMNSRVKDRFIDAPGIFLDLDAPIPSAIASAKSLCVNSATEMTSARLCRGRWPQSICARNLAASAHDVISSMQGRGFRNNLA